MSFRHILSIGLFLFFAAEMNGQVMNNNLDPAAQQSNLFKQGQDSTIMKSEENWKDEQAKIYFNTLNSAVARYPDTSIGKMHRFQPRQPWWGQDLGNYGTAVRDLFFNPVMQPGLSLGYHIYDLYQLTLDSLAFYNTTRPYSAFSFLLGSKNEQHVSLLHTQNISPRWNFAAAIRYVTSEGFYKQQKANNLSGSFSTNYQSENQRYYLAAGFVYNRFKQDENGGIISEEQLDNPYYSDRQLLDVRLPPNNGSVNSAVNNIFRNYDFYIQNNYSLGRTDTLYNTDSTSAQLQFTPRFRLKHQLRLHSEKHYYKDRSPETERYAFIGNFEFADLDSVFSIQNWLYVDNKFSLNGFLGKRSELVQIEAGIGNRIDRFSTDYRSPDATAQSSFGNYLFGELKKEAFRDGQWNYMAAAQFYFTGPAAGNFSLTANAGKELGQWAQLSAGLDQTLSNAPYASISFRTNYYTREFALDKTSITRIWGNIHFDNAKVKIGARNYLIANYLYYNESITPQQFKDPFSVLQIYGSKEFRFGIFSLDNEVVWQQATSGAPVNLPSFLLRHKLAIETWMFDKALLIALGIEVRYHTPYYSDSYTPYFNQFYLQNSYKLNNMPECRAFFNFKVRNFRAFVIADQVQQLVTTNFNAPAYPGGNWMFRFGFNWILIN